MVVDAVFWALPVGGDAFDAVWNTNVRNVRLLEAARGPTRPTGGYCSR